MAASTDYFNISKSFTSSVWGWYPGVSQDWPLAHLSQAELIRIIVGILYMIGMVRIPKDIDPSKWSIIMESAASDDPLSAHRTVGLYLESKQK